MELIGCGLNSIYIMKAKRTFDLNYDADERYIVRSIVTYVSFDFCNVNGSL